MTCPHCAAASRHQFAGDCQGCAARGLALGPLYFTARQTETMTPAYRSALQRAFGAEWKAGHDQVKAWDAKLKPGASS